MFTPFILNMMKYQLMMSKFSFCAAVWLAGAGLFGLSASAQVTERRRPAEWDSLIPGGRHMDRFLPMPDGRLPQGKTWGAPGVQHRFTDNGIELEHTSFWGGNILKGPDGTYHLYVCGWPESAEKGHMEWPNSTVYHATSSCLSGPYTVRDTVGKGHNPEAYMLADGRIVVYVIGGYYVADRYEGPWRYGQFEFDARDRRVIEGLSNLSFARRPDGSRIMVCRGGGIWISRDGLSPYCQLTDHRVYPAVEGEFEDPVIWRDSVQYHLIVNDWLGRIAFYLRSTDGVNWLTEEGEAYVPGISRHADGTVEEWFKYERPKVFQDEQGRVEQMNFAVIDTIKWEDHGNDRHSSKNICIPMNKGLLLSVEGRRPVSASTRRIRVRVQAEPGFDPARDVDLASLRFGASSEVNFGRGSRVTGSKRTPEGDLILTFSGRGSGLTDTCRFAPKLIGRDKAGRMLFGYARTAYLSERQPLPSARRPRYDSVRHELAVEVQNFGLDAASGLTIEVYQQGEFVARGRLPKLLPYDKTELALSVPAGREWDAQGAWQVRFMKGRQMKHSERFESVSSSHP